MLNWRSSDYFHAQSRSQTRTSNFTQYDGAQYLRSIYKTGTAEGSASGDCGACTAVLAEVKHGQLQYRSINTCITFVSSLHGKQLITVEDLRQGDQLHPVQQAMVEYHGSQCGYCTPGFIMSMFALVKNKTSANKQEIIESLAGNLCRCTGYRSILDAGLSLRSNQPLVDHFSATRRVPFRNSRDNQESAR